MSEPPLLDRTVIEDLRETIGADGVRSVIEVFIEESDNYLARIAAGAGDPAALDRARRAAHSLKSGAGQIGALAVAAAAAAVEQAAGSNTGDFAKTAAVLQRRTTDTIAALRALIAAPD